MGNLATKARLFLYASIQLNKTYELLKKRLQTTPGLPVPNPTLPLWTVPPAAIPSDPPDVLPEYADIVIIGSGITGTSFAYNALARQSGLKIVMLEAREVCSGATGRNGGHVNPPLYHDYAELRDTYGEHSAKAMMAFRLAHLTEMLSVASQEDVLEESQCRETEHLDVYTCPKTFQAAKDNLARWRAQMPLESQSFVSYERQEAIEKYRLSDQVVGCISNVGGSIHPYRFVTSLLSILLDRHHQNFYIFPHTPCVAISVATPGLYTVDTPVGALQSPHIIHATNGWCSHLLPPLRAKIVPTRGSMSAQRPGSSLHPSTLSGMRSFVFYRGRAGYDYLTQLPSGEHELMFGGGWGVVFGDGQEGEGDEARDVPDIGIADDSRISHTGQSYLAGALPQYFGMRNWGADAASGCDSHPESQWGAGRTKAQWSGILGISVDMLPWVGRLPQQVCGRAPPKPAATNSGSRARLSAEEKGGMRTATPGEWIAAGYSGEGMVHAWMSGKALACMVLDMEREERVGEWFPEIMRVTEKRWREANVEKLFARFF